MADAPAPVVDKTATTDAPVPLVVSAPAEKALSDAPEEKLPAEMVGDKPTVVQHAPAGSGPSIAPPVSAADPVPVVPVNGDKEAPKPVAAIPLMTSTSDLPKDNPPTAVSAPPPASTIPAPVEPVKESVESNEPAKKSEQLIAGTNGESSNKEKEVSYTVPLASASETKSAETGTKGVEASAAPVAVVNGDVEPSAGDKRKAEEPSTADPATNGAAPGDQNGESAAVAAAVEEPAAKKLKTSETSSDADVNVGADATVAVANGGLKRGPSRGKKEKKAPPPSSAGRTARKTRSQGPVEA